VVRVDGKNRMLAAHMDEIPGPRTRSEHEASGLDHPAGLV
jgi:hypothetical protein